MRRILSLPVLFFCLLALPVGAETLIAPLYPGAVSCGPDPHPGCFLSKDSFEEVKAFYVADKGGPTREESRPEKGNYAFFEYMGVVEVHKYDPVGSAIGVGIQAAHPRNGTPPDHLAVVGDIFGKVKMLVVQGAVGRGRYDELVDKYRHLAAWHYPRSDSGEAMDKVIRNRCETSSAEAESKQDMEAMATQAQELMMQGRHREAMELMQRVGQTSGRVYEHASSADGVIKYEKCLEELRENGYPTRIEIARDPSRS